MKYRIRKRILRIPSARAGRWWMKKIKFRKYEHLSLYRFVKIFVHNIREDEIFDRANGVSFIFLLATFPAIIFLFTIIPYITRHFPEVNTEAIMNFIGTMMPESMFEVIRSTVFDILNNQRGGLLTIGFFFALFFATNGMMSLMRAFNACYKTVENRNPWLMRLTATGLTFLLALAVLVAVVLLLAGHFAVNNMAEYFKDLSNFDFDTIYLLFTLRFAVIFVVFFLVISFIYYFGPAVHYNWWFFSIGSLVAALSIIAISYGFSYYITNFGSYNKVYGSIGVLIALMVWIQLITIILLFGYEINASLHYGMKVEAIDKHRRRERIARLAKKP